MRGVDVIIIRGETTATDNHGNPIKTEILEHVSDVLVNPNQTVRKTDNKAEENGITVTARLAFPKTYNQPLRGCRIVIPILHPSREWAVQGDPQPIPVNCPTRWNYPVEAVFSDG